MELPAFAIVFSIILALFGLFGNFLIFILVLLPSSSNQVSYRNIAFILLLDSTPVLAQGSVQIFHYNLNYKILSKYVLKNVILMGEFF